MWSLVLRNDVPIALSLAAFHGRLGLGLWGKDVRYSDFCIQTTSNFSPNLTPMPLNLPHSTKPCFL